MHMPIAHLRCLVPVMGIVILAVVNQLPSKRHILCTDLLWTVAGEEFEGFDNETGIQTGEYIVPNYLHFLRVGPKMKEFNFIDAVCVLAALQNQRPDKLFFHTDHDNFTGKFWEVLVKTEGFLDVVEFVPTTIPLEIFGQRYSESYHLFHAGDVLRINLLMKYGGIFLDNDCYLVQSLNQYRKYEFVLSWDQGSYLGTQVLVGHKDARFLKLWLESYRSNYHPDLWYYNAGERPTKTILWSRPELVHRVKLLFGTYPLINELYTTMWQDWRKQIVIHLLIRHIEHLKQQHFTTYADGKALTVPDEYTDENILHYPITLREMVKDVYSF